MKIEVYTDHNINGTQSFILKVKNTVADQLGYFSSDLTRIIVSFKDSNADKEGFEDKKCTIEARIQHMKPVAVSCKSTELLLALDKACDKMGHLLTTVIEKRRSHRSNTYIIDLLIGEKFTKDGLNDEDTSIA